jgi:alkanesulfonate monooxygenase SsuD/methylene tetrahydromethanopterin reductase-like flavin-dependent oxidoreductase (luciferase family)
VNIGLGLPISDPTALLDWARRADAGPFTTLGLLDRLAYDNPEPVVTLSAVAAVTTRIRVQTEVLLAPLHQPELLFGGFRPAALERVARWGDGFLAAAPPAWAGTSSAPSSSPGRPSAAPAARRSSPRSTPLSVRSP